MKRFLSIFMALVMAFLVSGVQCATAFGASKTFADDKLQNIQTQSGYKNGKTACVTGNCYAFVSKVCEKMYGKAYNGEGLYGNYKCSHSSGNYYTVSTYSTKHKSPTSSDVDNIKKFFVNNAVTGDVVHCGTLTSGSSNNSTHTFMIQSVDDDKMKIYHSNYKTADYSTASCHIDTIYWDSLKSHPTQNTYTSSGSVYSLNTLFYGKMKKGGMGITINRYSKYDNLYYNSQKCVPKVTTSASSSTGIKVKWDKIADAVKYKVQYKKSGDKSYTTATSKCTSNSFNVSGLSTGSKYYFRVSAYVGGKWMSYSSVVNTKVLPPSVSKANFETTADGLKISWSKRSDITGVKIYRSTSSDGTYDLIKTLNNIETTEYIDSTVKAGKKYYYKIVRYLKIKDTVYKSNSKGIIGTYALATPTVKVKRENNTSLIYSVSGDNLQSSYIYYVVKSNGKYLIEPTKTTQSTIEISGLKKGETYSFYVAEKNKFGKSNYSSAVKVKV